MPAQSGPDGRKPEGRESVRLADAPRPARRRRSLASARCGRPYRREPCRSLGRGRAFGRRYAQPVDGPHARGAEIRQSERLNARGADLSRVDLEFASLRGADLTGASLKNAQLGGADLPGVPVTDTDL